MAEQSDYLVDGKYSIADLIDLERLKTIFGKFNEATGFTIGLLDHPGKNVLLASGWREICTKFHRACPISAENCRISNSRLLDNLNEPGCLIVEECKNGLVDCATPIIIKGRHIASLATGQFFLKPPDLERFRAQAGRFGFDEEVYLEAVRAIPVIDPDRVKKATVFLGELAALVSELGYAKLELQEEAQRLEQEISVRRQIEEALKNEKERAQSFLNIAGVMVVAIGRDQKVILVNKKACEVLRCSEDDVIGNDWFDTFIPEAGRDRMRETFDQIVRGERESWKYVENAVLTKDGKERLVAWHNTVLKDENGNVIASLSSGQDITDRKREEEEKQKLLEAVQKAERLESLGILAGGIAHDFNNLLTGLFGFIDMARLTAEGATEHYLEKAMSALDRARGLTHQLLTFAKGGAPVKECAPLFPFITEAVEFALSGTPVRLDVDVQEDLWLCEYDRSQLGQAFDNIVINSIQAMPRGGTLLISARNVEVSPAMRKILDLVRCIRISVSDTGIGIPPEILPHIFDPFFTTKQKGSGVGLSSVYSIIKRHSGHIEVESIPGAGTTFHIYLPASDGRPSVEKVNVHKPAHGTGTVLIMDDERMIRDVTKRMLEELGYSVLTAEEGGGVLELFRKQKFRGQKTSAIILDLTVTAGLGGKETALKIREMDRSVPVYVASGYADDPVMANPGLYGFNGSLRKPFMLDDIATLLRGP